ncbi:WD40-repeat-containing domain protein [Pelagophyceae sp. CCMP2097]|nr:WD40-repeat-containing domain protein [Pelagophyceae sp. CCMP2097]
MSGLVNGAHEGSSLGAVQQQELTASVADYLRRCGYAAAAVAFADEARFVFDAEARPPVPLEKKWASIVRLQRRVFELEEELESRPPASQRTAGNREAADVCVRAPAKRELKGHRAAVTCVAASESLVATASDDASVRLWDISREALVATLTSHVDAVQHVAFDPDDVRTLISSSHDATAKVWTLDDELDELKASSRTLRGHDGAVSCGAVCVQRHVALTCGRDGTIRLWDIRTLRVVSVVAHSGNEDAWVRHLSLSDDLVASCAGKTAKVWVLETSPRCELKPACAELEGHSQDVEAIEWAPACAACALDPAGFAARLEANEADAKRLRVVATASRDCTVRVWRVRPDVYDFSNAADCLFVLAEHTQWVLGVVWHRSGRRLSTCSDDSTIRCWDVAKSRAVSCVEKAHASGVSAIALQHSTLISGGDRVVKVWDCR